MRCDEIKNKRVDYMDYTLMPRERQAFSTHLEHCQKCKDDVDEFIKTIELLKNSVKHKKAGITAGNDFEDRMFQALQNEKMQTKRLLSKHKKIAGIVAMLVVLMTILSFTPTVADLYQNISDLLKYAIDDIGIINSIEKGFGQTVDQSDKQQDVTFSVDNFISDKNRSILLFDIRYNGALDEKVDDMIINGLKISDDTGSLMGGYSMQYVYNYEIGGVSGNIEFNNRVDSKSITVGFGSLILNKQGVILPAGRVVDMPEEQVIELDSPVIKSVIVHNILLNKDQMTLDYTLEYTDKKYTDVSYKLWPVTGDQKAIPLLAVSQSSREDETRMHWIETFIVERIDINQISLEFRIPVKVIEGCWNVSFKPDYKRSENGTRTLRINQEFKIGGNKLKITEITFTPSSTKMIMTSEECNPLDVLGSLALKGQGGTEYRKSYGHNITESRSGLYKVEYLFDPIYEKGSLTLWTGGPVASISSDIRIPMDEKRAEAAIDVENRTFTFKYEPLEDNKIKLSIYKSAIPGYSIYDNIELNTRGLYIINSSGEKIFSDNPPDYKPIRLTGDGYETETLTFRNVQPGGFTIFVDSILKYEKEPVEIAVLR